MYKSGQISSEDFLEEIKCRIRHRYGNQTNFGMRLGMHRNTVSKMLSDPNRLTLYWANRFADLLDMDLRYFIV